MSKKEIRPFWTTTVDPSEYNYRKQFSEAVKIANKQKEVFSPLDIGKVWGLVESHARLERENAALREWVKEEGERTNICTYDLLNEICENCQCVRQKGKKP